MAINFIRAPILSGFQSTDSLETNFQSLETLLARSLSRFADSPNTMQSVLDMNSNRIINLPTPVSATEPSTFGQLIALSTLVDFTGTRVEVQTATAGQTVFNLSVITYAPGLSNLHVYIQGVRQSPSNYVESGTAQVTFSEGLKVGEEVQFVVNELATSNDTVSSTLVSYDRGGTGSSTITQAQKNQQNIHVNEYGAVGDGVTDDTTALQNVATAASSGLHVLFDEKTYLVYPTGSLGASQTLLDIQDVDGLTIDGNGATINIGDVFAGSENASIFKFTRCRNITIRNFNFTQTPDVSPYATNGAVWIDLADTCENIVIENCRAIGGWVFVRAVRAATDPEAEKCQNISVQNVYTETLGYPLSFQNSGDNVFVRNFEINGCGRAYFPYGVRNHDVSLNIRDGGLSPTCDLTVFDINTTTNYLEDIKLNVVVPEFTTAGPNIVGIALIHDNAVSVPGGTIRNIHINVQYNYNDTAALHSVVSAGKFINGGGADTTTRGWVMENISISGNVYNQEDGGNVIDFLNSGTFTGETISNVKVHDFLVTGSGNCTLRFDGDAFTDALVLDNVTIAGATGSTFSGTWSRGILLKNCILGGVYYQEQLINAGSNTLTMVLNGIVVNKASPLEYYLVSPEGGAPDILSTITGGTVAGQVIILQKTSGAANITVQHFTSGAANLYLDGGADFVLDNDRDTISLMWDGTDWLEVGRSSNH